MCRICTAVDTSSMRRNADFTATFSSATWCHVQTSSATAVARRSPPCFPSTLRLLFSTLLRLLFPSWAFFDEAVIPPTLEVRRTSMNGADEPWVSAVRAPRRRWWHVAFNPEGTRALAAQTLVERLYLAEVNGEADSDDARLLRTLVGNVTESALVDGAAHRGGAASAMHWEWRIVIRDAAGERIVASHQSTT